MKRRTWIYCCPPATYEVFCDLCGSQDCAWSEFWHHVWCFKCEKDVKGTPGIFGGPVPVALSQAMGMVFHRVSLKTAKVSYMDDKGNYSGWRKTTTTAEKEPGQ